MKHDPNSLTELIRNDDFVSWVRNPTPENDRKWQDFLIRFPKKKKTVEAARGYVILIAQDTGKHLPTEEQSLKMMQTVAMGIREADAGSV
jgi:transmembrane sensor